MSRLIHSTYAATVAGGQVAAEAWRLLIRQLVGGDASLFCH